jgi:hypothetical protein
MYTRGALCIRKQEHVAGSLARCLLNPGLPRAGTGRNPLIHM